MTNTPDPRAAAAQDIMAGLLALATDTLRKMSKADALTICDGIEVGTHVLSFGVSMTGRETVIAGKVTEVGTGASIDMPALRVRPDGIVTH